MLSRERALLVVTHEPDLFAGVVEGGWFLEQGVLRPLRERILTPILTMPPEGVGDGG
jgi:hypothetical protein